MIQRLRESVKKINSDHLIHGKGYLSGLLGAISVLLLIQLFQTPSYRFGTVNITGIVDRFVKEESSKNIPQEQLRKEVTAFGRRLEKELKGYSKANHTILLPSEAVIAGGTDYTDLITHRLLKNGRGED